MVKLCVFDLDGTLVNSLHDLADAANFALAKNRFKTYPTDDYRYFVGDGVPMLIKRVLSDNDSPENERLLLTDFNFYYNSHYDVHTTPYGGILEMLSKFEKKGIMTAVLSNKPDNFVKIIVNKIFTGFKFSHIQGKADGFPKKPDPTALNSILKELGAAKNETLYIGDSNVDIFTGRNAGVKTCGVLWGFRTEDELRKAGADFIISEPSELTDIVSKL